MKTFQSTLLALSFEPTLSYLFAMTSATDVARLADWLATADPYNERERVSQALTLVSPEGGDLRAHVEHQLWCAWRQAAWTSGLADPLSIRIEGADWLQETEGLPTLLVTPMTLAPGDAMDAIARLNTTGRPCVVFGEDFDVGRGGVSNGVEVVSGMSGATIRRIVEVLGAGGVLCTYPDFVYEGRDAESIPLFGTKRPVSSGFLSLAARHGTMLLPLVCLREPAGIVVHLEEPLCIEGGDVAREDARGRVAQAVAELLETLIRQAGEQWLLLPTLTFESPQMAGVR